MSVKDVYTITCSALPEGTLVVGFRGTEAISQLYQFDVYLLVLADGADLDLSDVVGGKAKLTADRNDARPPFAFNGIIASCELMHEYLDRSYYHAVIVPQLWYLTQTFHSRMWTQMKITDVIKDVLETNGITSSKLQLSGSYRVEEHVCQYKESDFDFICRWMEREGMYFYFDQDDDEDKLVISDDKSFQKPLDPLPVRFYPLSGHDVSAGEALHTFTCTQRALPASVRMRDYNYANPTLNVSGTAAVSKSGSGEISVYGNRFFSPDDGKRLATIRSEELLATQAIYKGTGTEFLLRAGYQFTLEDHPRAAYNAKYLVVSLEHWGVGTGADAEFLKRMELDTHDRVYWVEVKAIVAKVQYRAPSTTEWPRIYGHENGTVAGPADSEYAQIDDSGRYNVKFKFDESDLAGGNSSTWVRMMQPHGGNPEGFHFPLRKGTEVVFTFLGGDPDRPVITGVVPDAHHPSPITSSSHTKNVLQTGGLNRMEIEDLEGQQRWTMQTPHKQTHLIMGFPVGGHEFIARTQGNSLHHTDVNHDQFVGANCTIVVQSNQSETIHATATQIVIGDVSETHQADHTHTTQGDHTQTTEGDHKHTTEGDHTHTTKGDHTQKTEGDHSHTTEGDHSHKTEGDHKEKVDGDKGEKTDGDHEEETGGMWKRMVHGATHWEFEAAKNELTTGVCTETFLGGKIETNIGLFLETTAGAKLELVFGPNTELHNLKNEAKESETKMAGVESKIAALYKATKGLEQASVGMRMAQHGGKIHESGLEKNSAGIRSCSAGLHDFESALETHE